MDFTEQLLQTLTELEKTFLHNELAYLAATSKVEGPIRDRIAYGLHMRLDQSEVFVHREWRDPNKHGWIDIAVTDKKNHPRQLIELKAHSGPTFENGYSDKVRKDLQKLYKASEPDTELYLVFLFNHLYHPTVIDKMFEYVVKYYALQNFASKTNSFARDVRDKTTQHWKRHLQEIGVPLEKAQPSTYITGGNFYTMTMEVHAYVLGPMYSEELKGLFP